MKTQAIEYTTSEIYVGLDTLLKKYNQIISKCEPFKKWEDYKKNTYMLSSMIYYLLHLLRNSINDIDTYKNYEYAIGVMNMLNSYINDITEMIYMKGEKYKWKVFTK